MELTPVSRQLGCGRDLDEVWAGMDRPPDEHERQCPYCTDARADLTRLSEATRALRDEDRSDPALRPSPGVTERILAIARAEVRRGRRLPLDRPVADRPNELTVSEQAVATVIRRIGDRSGQVEIRHCSVRLDGSPDPAPNAPEELTEVEPPPSDVRVSTRVSVEARAQIPGVVDRLRIDIIGAVRQEVGINVLSVEVVVEDVHGA